MSASQNKPGAVPPRTGYSHTARTALQQTTLQVREMHTAIAEQCFRVLNRIPIVALPAQVVQRAHDAIASGVYDAIHHGAGAILSVAALLEEHAPLVEKPPGRLRSGLIGALNGALGDRLTASNSVLGIDMGIYVDGMAIALHAASLRAAFPAGGDKICLFVHGLGCHERSWEVGQPAADGSADFAPRLQAEQGYTPIFLRYNSGLPIDVNGRHLADLLVDLLAAWPCEAPELVFIGHSMGGLVVMAALQQGAMAAQPWLRRTRMVICLGSPHLGAPLARLGEMLASLLDLSTITRPLATLANARSQGIKDLRHGLHATPIPLAASPIAYRFIGATLSADVEHPLGKIVGDGLVSRNSATASRLAGDVQSVTLGNLGHLAMQNDARVLAQIQAWLTARNDAQASADPPGKPDSPIKPAR